MKILYHWPMLTPKMPKAEALSQEIGALCQIFDGRINPINPNNQSPVYIPRILFGTFQLRRLWREEAAVDIHHIYNPDPYPYPILRLFTKPVIYSLTSSVGNGRFPYRFFERMTAVTVYDKPSLNRLQALGLRNIHHIPPGVDVTVFGSHPPPPPDSPFLIASAPWVTRQFAEKGIDLLLDTAVAMPNLRLIFLWRGVLADEMEQRVLQRNLQSRVQIINRLVDVNDMLATCAATINLASHAGVIKAYPHSLMDSIVASRPVITSRTLAMAEDVEAHNFGVVVDTLSVEQLKGAIETIQSNYDAYWQAVNQNGRSLYNLEKTLAAYHELYKEVLHR